MEPEFWDKNPFKATDKAFPSDFHFKPIAVNKTRTFYEIILVDSNSVSIKHFKDPKDQSLNTHSNSATISFKAYLETISRSLLYKIFLNTCPTTCILVSKDALI